MKKNIFIILLALIMCVPLFAACSDSKNEESLPSYNIVDDKKEKRRSAKRIVQSVLRRSCRPVREAESPRLTTK